MAKKETPQETAHDWRNDVGGIVTPADAPIRSYPSMQWLNGKPGMVGHWRERGHFFIPDESNVSVSGENWSRDSFVTTEGEAIKGWRAEAIRCSVIRARRCWVVPGPDNRAKRFPWDSYGKAKQIGDPRGKMQICMAVHGVSELVGLTLRGMNTADATARGGWGDSARRFLYDPASYVFHAGKKGPPQRLPALAFHIVIGGMLNADGSVYYKPVGTGSNTSRITPIALLDPTGPVKDADIGKYVVPRHINESYEIAYAEAEEWVAAWETASNAGDDDYYAGGETSVE